MKRSILLKEIFLVTIIVINSISSKFLFNNLGDSLNNDEDIEEFFKNYKMNKNDNMSYSQADGAVQHNLEFNIEIDMKQKIIDGKVRLHYKCKQFTNFIGLDVKDLRIFHIKDENENSLKYIKYINNKNSIGDGLIVLLKDNCRKDSYIDILYSTIPNVIGIHYSDPSVLHNKDYTFLYTHGEAIYGRTIFPSQDTPSLKVTSTAKIRIKQPYRVLYSGEYQSEKILENNLIEYNFKMDKAIPTYLITFAAGVLSKKEIKDSRCEVWGEKEALKWIDESFKYCEDYITFYETYKPLAFNKMTFLIVPNDYPFSGMENPYVIYISESVLAKDMSYSNVIAHEIAHFWSGNLVTNKNWSSFWLNEGITTYLNRKAYRVIHGEEFFNFQMYGGLLKLSLALKDFKKNKKLNSSFRSLSPIITDDPYKTFSRIAYEKGSFFMYYIETEVGSPIMQKIMSSYFDEYQFESLDTNTFIKFLKNKILKFHEEGKKIINKINWDEWLKGTEGLPVELKFSSKTLDEFKSKIQLFKNGGKSIKELSEIFSSMKIVEKDKILKNLSDDIKQLSNQQKKLIAKFLEKEDLFSDHITILATRKILQGKLIENKEKLKTHLLDTLENFKFYKVLHLKKIFNQLKTVSSDKKFLNEVLNTYSNRLNPIGIARIRELIESF